MKSRFSEFSYGFAITNELVGLTSLRAAPIFPSLIEEGKQGIGYDVMLDAPGIPLYLQFKRSDLMVRGTAREKRAAIANGQWLDVPFHRFPITPVQESSQHLLCWRWINLQIGFSMLRLDFTKSISSIARGLLDRSQRDRFL
jgi:hypothetical protein